MECRLYLEDAPRGAEYTREEVVDLGGRWEAMNFLLTGKRQPDDSVASLLVKDWPDLDGSEAAIVDAEALASFNEWLASQADDVVLGRFDPLAMAAMNIYGAAELQSDPALARENLAQILTSLRAFAARGAQIGSAAIRVIV